MGRWFPVLWTTLATAAVCARSAADAETFDMRRAMYDLRAVYLDTTSIYVYGYREEDSYSRRIIRAVTEWSDDEAQYKHEWLDGSTFGGHGVHEKPFPSRLKYDGVWVWESGARDSMGFTRLCPAFDCTRNDVRLFTDTGRFDQIPKAQWGVPRPDFGRDRLLDSVYGLSGPKVEGVGTWLLPLYNSYLLDYELTPRGYWDETRKRAVDDAKGDMLRCARSAAYDFVPVSAQKYRLFFVSEPVGRRRLLLPPTSQRTAFVLDYEFHDGFDDKAVSPKHYWNNSLTLAERFPVDFVAPFHCYPRDGAYFFVLESGELYGTTASVADRTSRRLPLRDGELIQTVITDLDRSGAAFAFTSKYWFEVREPIEYRAFELGPLKADDPLPTLVRAAREVRKFYPAIPKQDAPPEADAPRVPPPGDRPNTPPPNE
mgnify:FL=1